MKTIFKISLMIAAICLSGNMMAQKVSFGQIQNQISRDKDGINVFDVQKDSVEYKGISIDLGGAFNMDFQAINSFNDQPVNNGDITGYRLLNNQNNFTLPAADMTIGAQLFDGVRVNLDVYLASRHHNETYVKGGYLQIDKLDFIKKDFLAGIMQYATIKIGQMENNYGDAHFKSSDNGSTLKNAFVGNNIMNAFSTQMGIEVYYNRNGWVSMLGATNGNLNQTNTELASGYNTVVSPTVLAKLGYDKQINNDLRVRFTGSYIHSANMGNANIYSGSRSGFGYWSVLNNASYNTVAYEKNKVTSVVTPKATTVASNYSSTSTPEGTFNPNFKNWYTSLMFNPFVKYKGLEFFGTIELASGGDNAKTDDKRTADQYAGELLYRFGKSEQFYLGGKYNTVSGKLSNADAEAVTVDKVEASAGWFMTKNILAKLAYVNQNYKDYSQTLTATTTTATTTTTTATANNFYGGKFNGLVFEAVISF